MNARRLLVVLTAALAASWYALPAGAIQDGTIDTEPYRYPNVVCVADAEGPGCGTGTLIGRRVVLTAAHVIALGWADLVSPDAMVNGSSMIRVERAVIHPMYFRPDGWKYDIGVLILARPITGVPLAELPTEGLLDELQAEYGSLDKVPGGFTVVGYGTQFDESGNEIGQDFRRYGPAYVDGLPDKWFNLNFKKSALTPGDSGATVFLGDSFTLAGVVGGWTRVDTPSARSFLGEFVTLP